MSKQRVNGTMKKVMSKLGNIRETIGTSCDQSRTDTFFVDFPRR